MLSKWLRFATLLFASTMVAFALVSLSPIDPVQQYVIGNGTITTEQRAQIADRWGVNDAPIPRYWKWLKSILGGDLGESIIYRQPVAKIIIERMQNTLLLMAVSWVISGSVGYFLGCLMGMYEGSKFDRLIKRLCLALSSVPTYWLGLVLLMFFSVYLKWFPIGFSSPIGLESSQVTLGQKLHHLILPALTLSFVSFSSLALYTRQLMIQVYQSNFVLFSYARGLSKWTILWRHGVKNTLGSAMVIQFSSFAELFGGSILAENIFSYPGLGTAISAAGLRSDTPLLLGITIFSVVFVFTGNLLADLIHQKIDPRTEKVGV